MIGQWCRSCASPKIFQALAPWRVNQENVIATQIATQIAIQVATQLANLILDDPGRFHQCQEVIPDTVQSQKWILRNFSFLLNLQL